MEYNVKVDAFEGPLDLLLHLINRFEIDIYDIPVAQITEQYMMYIHTMQELELDVASEYLVIAATLLAIKSKMLLPKHEEEELAEYDEFDEEEDPRQELIQQLVEYRKFKEAAESLRLREEERKLAHSKLPSDLSHLHESAKEEQQELDVTMYDMLSALQKMMKRKQIQRPVRTTITRQEIPIEKRMEEIVVSLRKLKKRTSFFDLFPSEEKPHIVVTFLAVLELMKQNSIVVEQEGNFDELFVSYREGRDS
ncbi:segregation/condensation protein A [Priestia koreensis]|uniref:segregation/condensation protein A n=1 Tax=Priestia koreensis TaxID=284581 RepID=UPI0028F6DFBA|nr:segregation/condensation protein A [Priestia koreensis]